MMKEVAGAGDFVVTEGSAPNVVSSGAEASDGRHYVEPLRMAGKPPWREVEEVVGSFERGVRVVDGDGSSWLRAECRSLVFRFVDDLWLMWNERSGVIEVKSASRVGYSDLGVNRRRVERLRAALVAALSAKGQPANE